VGAKDYRSAVIYRYTLSIPETTLAAAENQSETASFREINWIPVPEQLYFKLYETAVADFLLLTAGKEKAAGAQDQSSCLIVT
jgi:hypothetical protein